MGEITAERDKLKLELEELLKAQTALKESSTRFSEQAIHSDKMVKEQNNKILDLEKDLAQAYADNEKLKDEITNIKQEIEHYQIQKSFEANSIGNPGFKHD